MTAERIAPEHFDELNEFLQEPTMAGWLGPVDDDTVRTYLRGHVEHWERYGFGVWVFRDRDDGRFVGRGGIERVVHSVKGARPDEPAEETEILYAVDPQRWNQGLATEMAEAFVRIAFERLDLHELIAFTLHRNIASQRVMQKVGFTYDHDIAHAGEPHVLYRLRPSSLPRL
jgi:RimJ/RimL family protein N-acetyltransferase